MIETISKEEQAGVPFEPKPESNDQLQRGHYRQYEEPQTLIDKIRAYRRQRYPDSEIMKMLDEMPRRTYYNYVKKMQEQDIELVEQWMADNMQYLAEELAIFRENACQILRGLQGIIDDEKTTNKEKLKAMEQYFDVSESLVTQSQERIKKLQSAEYHGEQDRKKRESRKEIDELKKRHGDAASGTLPTTGASEIAN